MIAGLGPMFGISFIDYRNWRRWAPGLYILNLILLLVVMRGGHSALGSADRTGPLGTFQPSEPAKLVGDLARKRALHGHLRALADLECRTGVPAP